MAARWIGTIAPRGVLNYAEEEARGVFQSGKALFMRNWPYAWALAQQADSPIRDRIGVALLPQSANGRHAAALGGWQLGISRYSTHPALAADLVMYLSSAAIQKERAIKGSFNPTRPQLYQDEDILSNNRFMAELGLVFAEAVSRPAAQTGLKYPQVSQAFWDTTHAVLSGKTDAPSALKKLDAKLKQIKRRSW
jgi:trehalose/maltose transport system substrate-binding protein